MRSKLLERKQGMEKSEKAKKQRQLKKIGKKVIAMSVLPFSALDLQNCCVFGSQCHLIRFDVVC